MNATWSKLATAVLLALFLAPAWAADVPVSYTVDNGALKAAILGTQLTFSLYTDAACTAQVHTQVVNSENVTVISKLKRFRPTGATKPPKTDDLRTTLTGVTPSSPLYLKVTGTGITPVGGACQVQPAGLQGPPGGPGPVGPPGPGYVVKDSNGATVGIFDGANNALHNVGATLVHVPVDETGFVPNSALYYTSTDCSGTALSPTDPNLAKYGGVAGTTVYFGPSSGAMTTTNSVLVRYTNYTSQAVCDASYGAGNSTFVAPYGCCWTYSQTFSVGPAQTGDLSAFVPPFHLE